MPVYEYECTSCGRRHEVMQKFSEPLLKECPLCKGKLKKLISNTSFVLKGSGWYVTDYARKDNGKEKKIKEHHPSKGEKKTETAAEAKSPSKPEPKSEPANDSKSADTKSPPK
jgi:putative FmdB family regulatory protein